ncbi:response regulator [Mesorhizobium sophorae]|uniref:response regulator n=1 Tax=Mesorhizobium sophorae TaxID=1300294 RepID=UPI000BA36345|nr:response regulator [Mesorhizobium sophorae]
MKKPKVLVLEDEVIIGMDIEAFLWDEGFEVMLTTDCDVAIQWLSAETPDVAVLDVQLKNGTCTPLAKKLVSKNIPFIVHTGAGIEGRDQIFRKGVLMVKPVGHSDLAEAIKALLAPTTD